MTEKLNLGWILDEPVADSRRPNQVWWEQRLTLARLLRGLLEVEPRVVDVIGYEICAYCGRTAAAKPAHADDCPWWNAHERCEW